MESPFTNFVDTETDPRGYNETADEILSKSPLLNPSDEYNQYEEEENEQDDSFTGIIPGHRRFESNENLENENAFYENDQPVSRADDPEELNRNYSEDIGWGNYTSQINDLLLQATGKAGQTLSGSAFTSAVIKWKQLNGFAAWNINGVIDLETWSQMAGLIGISPLLFSINSAYSKMNLASLGLSYDAFRIACNGFRKLDQAGKLKNNKILSIADFTQSSRQKRLYILDMRGQMVLLQTKAAHGVNSVGDSSRPEFASIFANVWGSFKSSIGFYVTAETFDMKTHKRGLALKLDGQEKGFNDNARDRGIVIHGAPYVLDDSTDTPGTSQGCPAVDFKQRDFVVKTLKNGTCYFIYYNDADYLKNSSLAADSNFGKPAFLHEETDFEDSEDESHFETNQEQDEEWDERKFYNAPALYENENSDKLKAFKLLYDTDYTHGDSIYLDVSVVKGSPLKTGVFRPYGFTPTDTVDIIVYLYGQTKDWDYGEKPDAIKYYWESYSDIRDHFYKSKRNALLIAPTLPSNPEYGMALKKDNGLDDFVTACFAALKSNGWLASTVQPSKIILAAHSAGGSPLSIILGAKNLLNKNIVECWGFDCMYKFYPWTEAFKANPTLPFYHYWAHSNDGGESGPGNFSDTMQKTHSNLKSIAPPDVINHPRVIEYAWVNEINKRSWFSPMFIVPKIWETSDREMPANENGQQNEDRMQSFDFFAPEDDPILFYEDVKIKAGESLPGLAAEYGFDPDDWREIWNDPKNAALVTRRIVSTNIREGDIINIPIKWRILNKSLNPSGKTFQMIADRNGKEGARLDWVQTVYGDNQPNFHDRPFPAFSVDLPTEDDLPFYWTQREYDSKSIIRNHMEDQPNRNPPTAAQGTTNWRAVTSLCVVTNKRVSIWNTFVWGINFKANAVNDPYPIRSATNDEIQGHMNLLRKKSGKSNRSYTDLGWTFRSMNSGGS